MHVTYTGLGDLRLLQLPEPRVGLCGALRTVHERVIERMSVCH